MLKRRGSRKDKKSERQQYITNYEIRSKWEKKKTRLKFRIAVFFSALNFLGVELMSPHYSITEEISKLLVKRPPVLKLIMWMTKTGLFLGQYREGVYDPAVISHIILIIFVATFSYIIFYVMQHCDPFSNSRLLSRLFEDSKYMRLRRNLYPWMKEIVLYATILPSNRLQLVCERCGDSEDCMNSIYRQVEIKVQKWADIFRLVSNDAVDSLSSKTLECRKAFFMKYGFFMSGLFLFLGYLFARLFEKYVGIVPNVNPLLILLILACLLFWLVFSLTNPITIGQRGVWGEMNQMVDNLFGSEKFEEVKKQVLCSPHTE